MADNDIDDPERREFLNKATCLVAGAGVAAASWPFISSMNPSKNVASNATTEVDIAAIPKGEGKTIEWQKKPIFLLHRSENQIAAMNSSYGSDKDPEPDGERIQRSEWLVVVGICTHLGCVPNRAEEGWLCPCHGSVYDNSGRILSGPAPTNLVVPPYEFVADDKIVIG